jgi:hypothetical protein
MPTDPVKRKASQQRYDQGVWLKEERTEWALEKEQQ